MRLLQTIPAAVRTSRASAPKTAGRFWNSMCSLFWFWGSIYLAPDNLSAHPQARQEPPYCLRRRLRIYWLPTNSLGLNLNEAHFSVLKRTAPDNTDYLTPCEIDEGLRAGLRYLNAGPTPYTWTPI